MTDAQTILNTIESVTDHDAQADSLDEIDARVWCYVFGQEYIGHEEGYFGVRIIYKTTEGECTSLFTALPTRSRDALKAIRPEGWVFTIYTDGCYCTAQHKGFEAGFDQDALPTEELAELHAIIQAIEWERENAE